MEAQDNSKKTMSVAFLMATLILLVVIIPFSSSKKETTQKEPPLVFRTRGELGILKEDKNGNQTEDWKDLILETMSSSTKSSAENMKVDPDVQKRLDDPNNLTSSFSKNIYTASSFFAKNQGAGAEEQAEIISEIVKKESSRVTIKEYLISDITLSAEDTTERRKTYGNAMALLLKKADTYELSSDDLTVLAQYTENKDPSVLTFFSIKEKHTKEILDGLLRVEVPPSASVFHLNLINAVSVFVTTLNAFSTTEEDPIKSLAFLNSYEETTKNLFIKIAEMQNYFTLEKIPFTTNEPGYVFINKK